MTGEQSDPRGSPNEDITVLELTTGILNDFLEFFDHSAFCDNPSWSGCYCVYYHTDNQEEWEKRTASENRDVAIRLIKEGRLQGLLAYLNKKPVGWCNAASRNSLPRLAISRDLRVEDAEGIGSIVCFVVAKPHRDRGIASRLLEAACDSFSARGFPFAEAYPLKHAESDAANFPGPLRMYLKQGFSVFRELDRYLIVRKPLRKDGT